MQTMKQRKEEETMEPRLDPGSADQEVLRAMAGLSRYVHQSGLDPKLVQLIEIRASQINGCGH